MIKSSEGNVSIEGSVLTIAADTVVVIKAFKDTVIDEAPDELREVLLLVMQNTIREIFSDNDKPSNDKPKETGRDPEKAFEAAKALDSLFEMLERAHK